MQSMYQLVSIESEGRNIPWDRQIRLRFSHFSASRACFLAWGAIPLQGRPLNSLGGLRIAHFHALDAL